VTTTPATSEPYYGPDYLSPVYPDDSKYPYANHSLAVDATSSIFRVIYSDNKNRTNDVIVEARSVQTVHSDGKVVIVEGNYTTIIYNDKDQRTESFMYEWNTK